MTRDHTAMDYCTFDKWTLEVGEVARIEDLYACIVLADECGLGTATFFQRTVTGYQDLHNALRDLVGEPLEGRIELHQAVGSAPRTRLGHPFAFLGGCGIGLWPAAADVLCEGRCN